MKRIVNILNMVMVAAALMAVLSCEKEEPSVDLGGNLLTFKAQGGSESFTYTCNYDWTATPSDAWITVSPASGAKGSGTVNVQVAANDGTSKRVGNVTFTCEGLNKTVRIEQAQPLSQKLSFRFTGTSLEVPDIYGNGLVAEVDWGDGTKEDYSISLTHSYSSAGPHDVTIKAAGGTSLKFGKVDGMSKINLADF